MLTTRKLPSNTTANIQAMPAIYRLIVMWNTTSTLDTVPPGSLVSSSPWNTSTATAERSSLNSASTKATFYIFHLLPEWCIAAILASFDFREMFQTGQLADSRWRDETMEEREKRERKEREKRQDKSNSRVSAV